jgi:hypothetical protein
MRTARTFALRENERLVRERLDLFRVELHGTRALERSDEFVGNGLDNEHFLLADAEQVVVIACALG